MSQEDFRLPSTAGFAPGDDDLTQEQVRRAYNEYSRAVAALVDQAARAGEPIFRTLYQEAPDFLAVLGILSIASTDQATKAEADTALELIDREQRRQRADLGQRDVNEFYEGRPTGDARSGLGWNTRYGTENDRWARPAPMPTELDSDRTKANKQLADATRGALRKGMDSTWSDGAHGNQSGKFDSDSQLRGAKSYADHPGTLVMLHVSRALYNYMIAKVGKVTEVQMLCVGSRIVACANESVADRFLESFKTTTKMTLLGLIKKVAGKPRKFEYRTGDKTGVPYQVLKFSHDLSMREISRLQPEQAAQVLAEAADTDEENIVRSVVDAVAAGKTWEGGSYANAIAWLTDPRTENGVFWMDPPTVKWCHAEGALVALLVESGATGKALIAGTMRPCTGCYLTLRYARERLGVDLLGAPTHNGGFWETTQLNGMLALVNAFNEGQLRDILRSPDVDAETRARVEKAFRLEGVAAFCRFIERNFPESTNASNLLSLLTQPQPGLIPDTPFRRTITMPEEHMRQFLAARAGATAPATDQPDKGKEEEEEEEDLAAPVRRAEDEDEEEEPEYWTADGEGEGEGPGESEGEGPGEEEEEEPSSEDEPMPTGSPESKKRKREDAGRPFARRQPPGEVRDRLGTDGRGTGDTESTQ